MKFFLILISSIFLCKILNAMDIQKNIYICKPQQFISNTLSIVLVGDDYQINVLNGKEEIWGPNETKIKSNIINGKMLSKLPEKYQKFYKEEIINKLHTRLYFPDDKIVLQNKVQQTFEFQNTSYIFDEITQPIFGFRMYDEEYAFDWDKEEKSRTFQFNFLQNQLYSHMGSTINLEIRSDGSLHFKIFSYIGNILGIELPIGSGFKKINFLVSRCYEDEF